MLKTKASKILTLLLIHQENRILLAMKKKGFGKGKFNGFGGKVQKNGQTIFQAAIRQTQQEGCIRPTDAKLIGYIKMDYDCEPQLFKVFIFRATQYVGEVSETEQMKAQWFSTSEIPFTKMWIDDPYWMPYLLQNKCFKGYLQFEGHQKLLKVEINQLKQEELLEICNKQSEIKVQ